MGEQLGLIYYESELYIETPNNDKGLRLFRRLSDGQYYVKKSDGTLELFSVGLVTSLQASFPSSIFQRFASVGNVGAGVDTLYSDNIPASKFTANGQEVSAHYAVRVANNANVKSITLSFGGQNIFTSTTDFTTTGALALDFNVKIMRSGATTARVIVSMVSDGLSTEAQETQLAGVDFSIANALAIFGEGVADNDIIADFAKGLFFPN